MIQSIVWILKTNIHEYVINYCINAYPFNWQLRSTLEPERASVIFLFIYAYKVFAGHYENGGKRGWFTTMKGDYVEIEILGLYWHFVDLVWVFIFAFFYLW